MEPPDIILASASPRRLHLLTAMGLKFTVIPPVNVEELLTGPDPVALAVANARRKAEAVAARFPAALVIGADTLVVLDGRIFGKPADPAEAESILASLVGRRHEVITGVSILWPARNVARSFCDTTPVWMRSLTPAQIREYLGKINPLDKAGAYAIQEHGAGIVERIDGSYHNVMGLPTEKLAEELRGLGVSTPALPRPDDPPSG